MQTQETTSEPRIRYRIPFIALTRKESGRPPRAPVLVHVGVLAAAVLIFLLQAPSFMYRPHDHLADGGDAILNAWILAWNTHAITASANFWNAPIYHPIENTLTFSETMIGNLWMTLPVQWLTGNHVLAANVLVFVCLVLGMYATFLLVRRITGSALAGAVAGAVFSFNPYRWAEVHHLQLLPMFWSPLALLCCHEFLQRRRTVALAGTACALVLQTYASIYLGVMLLVMLLTYITIHFAIYRFASARSILANCRLYVVTVITTLALAPLAIPYWQTVHDWDFARSESENSSFSAEPLSLFVPSASFRSYPSLEAKYAGQIRGAYFLGVTPWLLAGTALFLGRRSGLNPVRTCFAWTAALMAVFMLGPYLIWFNERTSVPLPYLLVYHVLPGAQALRVPARFVFPLLLCLAVLGGFAVLHLQVLWQRWRPLARLGLCLVGVFALSIDYAVANHPGVRLEPRNEFPPVYDYLADSRPGCSILELPADVRKQFRTLHYQTAHWRPLVGGESGCYPSAILELDRRTEGLPTDEMLQFIQLTTAETVVVHLDQYDPHTAAGWYAVDVSPYGFERMGQVGTALVWERRAPTVEISEQLRVVNTKTQRVVGRWHDGWRIELTVTAASTGEPWRYLERGLADVDVVLIGKAGDEHHYRTTVAPPPYLLPGERATITIGKLDGGPAEECSVRIRGVHFAD